MSKKPTVELEDVVLIPIGKGRFRVSVVKLRSESAQEKVLEKSVSLPVARYTARLWRAKADVLNRGL
jgi:hypothetical protein